MEQLEAEQKAKASDSPTKNSSVLGSMFGGMSFELLHKESQVSMFSGSEKELDIYMLPIIDIEEEE